MEAGEGRNGRKEKEKVVVEGRRVECRGVKIHEKRNLVYSGVKNSGERDAEVEGKKVECSGG